MTNILQFASGPGGGVSNSFSNRSSPLVSPPGSVVTLNYVHVGGATNGGRYYRVQVE